MKTLDIKFFNLSHRGFELLPQVDYAGIPFELQKEDTNTIWGDNADKRRKKRDTMLKSTLRGRRKGTLKVPGQVVLPLETYSSLFGMKTLSYPASLPWMEVPEGTGCVGRQRQCGR